MKLILLILIILVFSCKKQTKEPEYTFTVECYCKSKNANIKLINESKDFTESTKKLIIVAKESELDYSIVLKNNIKTLNDSLSLTINGKQRGVKLSNTFGQVKFQLNEVL